MTTKLKLMLAIVVAVGSTAIAGCGRGFDIKTPPGFVELRNQEPAYGYRATTPEGVVISVRKLEAKDRGDLAFWERAISLHLRDTLGYALVSTTDVSTFAGKKGRQMRYGHDENGRPFVYWVTVFPGDDVIYVLEAGGPEEQMKSAEPQIQWHVSSLKGD